MAIAVGYTLVAVISSVVQLLVNWAWDGELESFYGRYATSAAITLPAVVVVAVLALRWSQRSTSEVRDCVFCLQPIPVAARVCFHCTRSVEDAPSPPA